MKKLYTFILIFLIVTGTNAQTITTSITWQNTIGGSNLDELHAIKQTADGGYILCGWSESNVSGDKTENSNGGRDYWIIKLDALGNIAWQNTIGGSDFEDSYSIQPTTDGGYILGGRSDSPISGDKTENTNGLLDYWIIKLDGSGNIVWQNSIGGSSQDQLTSLQQTSDGGYILGGFSASSISGDKTENSFGSTNDYWVLKLDPMGNIVWQNTIGGNGVMGYGMDDLRSIKQTSDGGYILGGSSNSNLSGDKTEGSLGEEDYWVIKLDNLGNIQWQNTIGGNSYDYLYSVEQTSDGGYILGGYSLSNISGDKTENCIGGYDYWVVKLDPTGNIQWQNTIGGNSSDLLFFVQQTSDGGYALGGSSISAISGDKTEACYGGEDYWLVKLNASGNIEWQKTIGGSNEESLRSIQQTSDGNYILGGFSNSDISGDKTENTNGLYDFWVVKLSLCEYASMSSVALSTSAICDGSSANLNITGNLNDAAYWYLHTGSCSGLIIDSTVSNTFTISPSDTTQYFVTGEGGCTNFSDSCLNVTLNVHPTPSTPTIAASGSTTFCDGGSVNITSSTGDNYLWNTGATTNAIIVSSSDTVFVQVESNEGCISDTSNMIMVSEIDCSSIEAENNVVTIFPNPTSNYITIQTNEEIKSIQIIDMMGKVVATFLNVNTVDISALENGMYTMEIMASNKIFKKKIIKK